MSRTCCSICSWRFSPQTRTRRGEVFVFVTVGPSFDRAAGGAGSDVLLGDDQQDDRGNGGAAVVSPAARTPSSPVSTPGGGRRDHRPGAFAQGVQVDRVGEATGQ